MFSPDQISAIRAHFPSLHRQHNGHTLACVPLAGMMVSHVVLFGVFHASFITANPCREAEEPNSLVFFVDPATKACTRSDLLSELAASRVKFAGA